MPQATITNNSATSKLVPNPDSILRVQPTGQLYWCNDAANTSHNINEPIHKENDTHYEFYICFPGYTKKEVWINTIKEKDFITLEIEFIGKFPTHLKIKKQILKIIKNIDDIDQKKDIKINMDNGLLMISIPKKYPIKRKELKF